MVAPRAAAKREYHSSRLKEIETAFAGPQSIWTGSSQHGLDLRWVFEKPGQQYGLCSGFVALGVLLHQEGRFFHVPGLMVEIPRQDALSQGTPGLQQNTLQPAVFHRSLPAIWVAG